MSCCGQKRLQWQQRTPSYQEQAPANTNADPVLENPVKLRYYGKSTIMVKGRHTGYLYLFAGGEPALAVDGRDVQDILSVSQDFSVTTS